MGEFFKGWRRKIGVLTLAMALSLTGQWFRGFAIEDEYRFSTGAGAVFHSISSSATGIRWAAERSVERSHRLQHLERLHRGRNMGWQSHKFHDQEYLDRLAGQNQVFLDQLYAQNDRYKYEWRWHLSGFDIGEARFRFRRVRVTFWSIPYWSIVLSLTLLSSWLLLVKPRVVKSKPPSED